MELTRKNEFNLECACGSQKFYVYCSLSGEDCAVRCYECNNTVASFKRYAVDWHEEEEKEKADVDHSD